MRVVLTRERGFNEAQRATLPADVSVREVPLTTTTYRDVDDVARDLAALERSGAFGSLVVSSVRSVAYVGVARSHLTESADTWAVGATTSAALEAVGVRALRAPNENARALAAAVTQGPVLVLGAHDARRELVDGLRERGFAVDFVVTYATEPLIPLADDIEVVEKADVIYVGAPSTWAVASPYVASTTWVLVPGDTTLDAVRRDHERVLVGWGLDAAAAWAHIRATEPPS